MKQLLILLCCLCGSRALAQNWQTISASDTNLFLISAGGPDSVWNNYIRCVSVDSSVNMANGVVNYFYPSVRLDKNDVIDTANGGTWLGKFNFVMNNGVEVFLNQYEDSIFIHSLAEVNDTWIICTKNGLEYHGKVISKTAVPIDGVTDSIKTIQIQAMQAGLPVANYYNSLQIILSKDHGFYTCFELFGFPDKVAATFADPMVYPYPYLPFVHQRIESSVTNTDMAWTNFSLKFKPGNEWMYSWVFNYWHDHGYVHDSIISSQFITPFSIQVTRYRHTYSTIKIFPQQQNPYDTSYHTFSTFVDTVNQPNYTEFLKAYLFEHKYNTLGYAFDSLFQSNKFHWYFTAAFCNGKLALRDSVQWQTPVSGWGHLTRKTGEGFGSLYLNQYEFQGVVQNAYEHYEDMFYLKLDSCIEGTKLNFNTLSAKDFDPVLSDLAIYPNPVSAQLFVRNIRETEISDYCIFDLSGHVYGQAGFANPILTERLPAGLYMIRFTTSKGMVYRKFLKE
jgi:hypothetical protein